MMYEFSFFQVLVLILLLACLVIGIIVFSKVWIYRNRSLKSNVFQLRRTFLLTGFILALVFVFIVFNWTTLESKTIVNYSNQNFEIVEIEIPITQHQKKKLPKPPPPIIDLVPEEDILEDQPEFKTMDTNIDDMVESPVEDYPIIINNPLPTIKIENDDIPFTVVSQMPRFPGCENESTEAERKFCSDQKLMKYIYGKLRYPELAREINISGRTHIRFVVDKSGIVSNVEILRDIGGGCGEAAAEVVRSMKNLKWIPGKQGGRKVSVYYNLPVSFELK